MPCQVRVDHGTGGEDALGMREMRHHDSGPGDGAGGLDVASCGRGDVARGGPFTGADFRGDPREH
jgi:hypothetical protein